MPLATSTLTFFHIMHTRINTWFYNLFSRYLCLIFHKCDRLPFLLLRYVHGVQDFQHLLLKGSFRQGRILVPFAVMVNREPDLAMT